MTKKDRGNGTADTAPASTMDGFSKQIHRKVMSDAVQAPSTLFPAAVALLSGLYMGLISFDETSFAVAAGSGLVSLLSWVYHYFIRGEKTGKEYGRKLLEKRKTIRKQQVVNIEEECRNAGFAEGESAARELEEAFSRLEHFLKGKYKERQPGSAERFLALSEQSYDQGVSFLEKSLSLYRALEQMDEEKLKKELIAWEEEAAELKKKTRQKGDHADLVLQALEEKIKSHRRRLELFTERSEKLQQVLAQCEILEARLDSSYLEVVDLMDGNHQVKLENVAGDLERAVSAARRVEERLRGIGYDEQFDDSIYSRQAGQQEKE
jgi:hypothetical protein